MNSWFLLDSGPRASAWNMACDEALLHAVARLGQPVLRFYGWTEPAATFGYSQKSADIARWTKLRPLIRRPTGGGLVPHDADWTYSLSFPPSHPWYALSAQESYQRAHDWVAASLARRGLNASLAECCQKDMPGQCFIGAEKFDVLWQGKKIAGAAQRRTKQGLLIQGSIQSPPGVARKDWQEAFCQVGTEAEKIQWQEFTLEDSLAAEINQLAAEKYSLTSYNEKR